MKHRRTPGLVSVVVTSWNRRQFILECLRHLRQQTYPNLEMIIVDDASTDGTRQVVASWKQSLPPAMRKRVIIVPLPRNVGYSGALTTGMFTARGEFIATHDSDDFSHPKRMEEQVRYLRNHPGIGLIGTNYRIVRNGKIQHDFQPNWISFGSAAIHRRYAKGDHCITCGSLMFRGSVFDKIGGLNHRIVGAEDYEFVNHVIQSGVRIDNLRKVLYYVRTHEAQRSRRFYR